MPPTCVQDLTVESDYGQIYVIDDGAVVDAESEEDDPLFRTLEEASESRRFVGFDRMINILTPSQYNWNAPLALEVWDERPPLDLHEWDHAVEGPFAAPSGLIYFMASGGGRPIEARVPPGTYRARVSGRDFVSGIGEIEGRESWRIQLWPAPEAPPELLKYWDGWDFMRPRDDESR